MRRCLFLPFLILGLGARAAGAQRDSTAAASRPGTVRGLWASGAVGLAGDGFYDAIGLHLQRGRTVLSVRKEAVGIGQAAPIDGLGVLLGMATTSVTRWHAAASLGLMRSTQVAYSVEARGRRRESGVGAIAAADVALRTGRTGGAGLGLTLVAASGAARSYAAIGLALSLGRWR